ncbi:hypothetical protein MB46_19895 (plasmid) [Arthrobacter alpinus]|uniref:class F sortase n=1 Tax=Arthrobacter alpinus TaxID=656366 RepID=UPI00073A85EA|nr:class F sortase [Arthrobacter alpinus]ALV47929.1 hypothetical protein MB46_19895 [Arthrobacter alpinus]
MGLVGIGIVAMGLLGAGSTPSYVPAPAMEKPFSPTEPDTFTGPTALPAQDKAMGPMELSVPSVGLRISIVDGGLDAQGRMILPVPDQSAFYTGAAPIGSSTGSTVVAGHVNHEDASPAPMGLLTKIEKGAPIFITDSSGKVHRYKAVEATLYGKHALPSSFFRTEGDPQLVLLTCGGAIGPLDGVVNFLDNAAVVAVPWP